MKHLGNKAGQLKLVGKPTQFGIYGLDPCNMRPGPPPMLRVCRYGAGLAFRGPWSGALAAVQRATVPATNGRVLARPASPGLCTAPAPRPIRPETRCMAGFSQSCVVSPDYSRRGVKGMVRLD